MRQELQLKIDRAKELLLNVKHAAMATVNQDGSPHNTPYFFMRSANLQYLYWGSSPESEHSKNVIRTGQVFVVLYDAFISGGLFIQANKAHVTQANELVEALKINNELRARNGQDALSTDYYTSGLQRMYQATVQRLWINASERGSDGHIIRDHRYQIKISDLL